MEAGLLTALNAVVPEGFSAIGVLDKEVMNVSAVVGQEEIIVGYVWVLELIMMGILVFLAVVTEAQNVQCVLDEAFLNAPHVLAKDMSFAVIAMAKVE